MQTMVKRLTGIVAADQDFLIGFNTAQGGRLPWGQDMPEDLDFFRKTTQKACILMGRKTAESIYQSTGNLLPERLNLVLSQQSALLLGKHTLQPPMHVLPKTGHLLLQSWQQFALLQPLPPTIFLIGGASLFAQALKQNLLLDIYFTRINTHLSDTGTATEQAIYLPKILCNRLHRHINTAKPIFGLEKDLKNCYSAAIYHLYF